MTRRELGPKRRETVTVYGRHDEPFQRKVSSPEEPGDYAFPPIAAAITGAARLLLALVEHEVTQAGGTYAFCDTDSMAIVATQRGGSVPCPGGPHHTHDDQPAIRALTYQRVETIRERFSALNPYDPAIVPGSILELEDENFDEQGQRRQLHCYAISAKRYTFYTDTPDGPELVKPSQHGLGHLLNPSDPDNPDRDWTEDTWRWLLHLNAYPAYAYRFDIKRDGSSVVFSGDTFEPNANLIALAQGVSLLVHEAMSLKGVESIIGQVPTAQRAGLKRHLLESHTDVTKLPAIAKQAGVRHVALTHYTPWMPPRTWRAAFDAAARRAGYRGGVTPLDDLSTVTVRRR